MILSVDHPLSEDAARVWAVFWHPATGQLEPIDDATDKRSWLQRLTYDTKYNWMAFDDESLSASQAWWATEMHLSLLYIPQFIQPLKWLLPSIE